MCVVSVSGCVCVAKTEIRTKQVGMINVLIKESCVLFVGFSKEMLAGPMQ